MNENNFTNNKNQAENAAGEKSIAVKDFTRPGAKDSAHGIRGAIREAIRTGAGRVVFESGRYLLDTTAFFKTEGMTHDKGSPANRIGKDVHIDVSGSGQLCLSGMPRGMPRDRMPIA